MAKTLPVRPDWLRANVTHSPVGVDRQAKVIRGYVVAQAGVFNDRRGQSTGDSLGRIVALMNAAPAGLKSRFTHPSLSEDGLGKFLGRSKAGRLDGNLVRGDLHFDDSAFNTPSGDLATYVMDLADSDPDAFGSSLVLQSEKVQTLDDHGRPKVDDKGEEVPAIWLPTRLHASDIVDDPAATSSLLSAEGLPDELVRRGAELLDRAFAGQAREVVESRSLAWLERYLAYRYGEENPPPEGRGRPGLLARRLKLLAQRA